MIIPHPLAARAKKPVGMFGSGLFAIKQPSHRSNKENLGLFYSASALPPPTAHQSHGAARCIRYVGPEREKIVACDWKRARPLSTERNLNGNCLQRAAFPNRLQMVASN